MLSSLEIAARVQRVAKRCQGEGLSVAFRPFCFARLKKSASFASEAISSNPKPKAGNKRLVGFAARVAYRSLGPLAPPCGA